MMFGVPPLGGDSNPPRRRRLKAELQTIALLSSVSAVVNFIPLWFRLALAVRESPATASLRPHNRCRRAFPLTSRPSSFSVRDSPQIKLAGLRSRAGSPALASYPRE